MDAVLWPGRTDISAVHEKSVMMREMQEFMAVFITGTRFTQDLRKRVTGRDRIFCKTKMIDFS